MSITVKLSLAERTLNALTRCNRLNRGGGVLERQKEEAAVLIAAFDEAREEVIRERDHLRVLLHAACLCAGCAAKFEAVSGEPHRKAQITRLEREWMALESLIRQRDEALAALRDLSEDSEFAAEQHPAMWRDVVCRVCSDGACGGPLCPRHRALEVLAGAGKVGA